VRLGWALGVVVVAAALGPVAVALLLGDRLATEVPRHYGPDGRPTALWPLWTSVTFLAVTTLVVAGGCAAACTLLRLPLLARRAMAWTVTWVAVLLGGMKVGALLQLVDTTDVMASGSISTSTAIALLAGMLFGVPVAALAREEPHGLAATQPPGAELPRLPDATEPAWRSAPLTSRALVVALAATSLLLVVPAVLVGPFGEGAWLLLLAIATLAPAAVFARVRVDIDADGLQVRGLGVRFVEVDIAEVARADVVDHLDPFWEFGGWGLRVDVHGRTGIVSRAGEALRVVRGDDTELLITVDDAGTAAATLNTLADHYHGSASPPAGGTSGSAEGPPRS
jgi:hypothetical protein